MFSRATARLLAIYSLIKVTCGQGIERGLVSYVLENFDVEDVEDFLSVNVLLDSVERWEERGGKVVKASVTAEAHHGSSAFEFNYENSEGGSYMLQNILDDSAVHAGAAGAENAFFTYRHSLAQEFSADHNDFYWNLVLFDSADCQEACSEELNLEVWEYAGGLLEADDAWHTVSAPLDLSAWVQVSGSGNGILDLRKLKGWRLEFLSATGNVTGTIIVDQLALDGDGSMIGTAFLASSWEEAIEDEIFAPIYYTSEISENATEEVIYDGHFYVNYTVEQTETWGGFIQYDFVAPGRAYFNVSKAQAIAMDYDILKTSSSPGRAHIRFLMLDRSDCWVDCGHFSPNLENYYSFHYILDEQKEDTGSLVVKLEGDGVNGSPFWRTGWFGSIGNNILDNATIKGYKIEISMDSQGEVGSLVSGIFDLSDLRVEETYNPFAIDTSMCLVEPNLRFKTAGFTKYQRIEFLNFAECCSACNDDPSCMFAFADGRDCYKTDYLHHQDLGYWTDLDALMFSFVKQPESDFCDVCECREADATIDCRYRDLVVLPKTFSPDPENDIPGPPSWSGKILDLRGNDRLVIVPAGSLDSLPLLEEIRLPANLKHLSSVTLTSLQLLEKIDFENDERFNNFVTSNSAAFSDVCCGLGDEKIFKTDSSFSQTLTFCDLAPDIPGVDAVYEDYIQYRDADVIDSIVPTSSFMSEAARNAFYCAEYCNIRSDCKYFSYDARVVNTEHVCNLLSSKGTPTEVCCTPDQMADAEGTQPGWISGVVPRARNEIYNAKVLLDSATVIAEETRGYSTQYQLKLGAMPRRGAVWITPTVVALGDPNMEIVIMPSLVVLYDNETVASVDIRITNIHKVSSTGVIVIENVVDSCDTAFSITKGDLTVYVDVILPENDNKRKYMLISVGSCLGVIICLSILFVRYAEQKKREADALWHVHPEELHFSNPPEVLGRGSFGLVLLGEYRGTQVAVKRVIPPRKGGKLPESGTMRKKSSGMFNYAGLFGAGDISESNSDTVDIEKGTSSIGTSSWNFIGRQSGGLSGKKYRGTTAAGVASGMRAAQKSYWHRAFQFSRTEDYGSLRERFIEEMRHLSKLRHPCITTVMGAVIRTGEEPMLVMEYMDHGSLRDMLSNETMVLEGEQILPILSDISQGLRFLHAAKPQCIHGDLKAANILVDGRLRAKVADFGLSQKKKLGATGTPYWMAPELIRGASTNTDASDVYSFGVILYEVYSRKEPYEGEDFADVMEKISDSSIKKRPGVPPGCPSDIETLMSDCWEEDPKSRPCFKDINIRVKGIDTGKANPSTELRHSFLKKQEANKDKLLEEVFPPHIAKALREGRKVEPESRDCVTIVFSDIVNFTTISSELSPLKVSEMLDCLYHKFDDLSHKHDCFKVETIGDSWMGVTNLTHDQPDHVERVARFAIDAMKAAQETWIDPSNPSLGRVNLRMGFHSGPVVANVVGSRNPRYCLFGDAVNTASRMESHSLPGRIQCSDAAAVILRKTQTDLKLTPRGKIPIKGKGMMEVHWIGDIDEQKESAPANSEVLATGGNTDPVTFEKTIPVPTHNVRPLESGTVRFAL